MCDALHYLLDNIFIRFGSKSYRQIVGILLGTYCAAPLCADLFMFFFQERDFTFPFGILGQVCYRLCRFLILAVFLTFMLPLLDNNQTDIIEAFDSTSKYLDELLILIILI